MSETPANFFKVKPWIHQDETFETCKDRDFYGLFYEMGTGKTATAINIVRWKYALAKRVLRTLILAPVAVVHQWAEEWYLFGGERYDEDEVHPVHGSTKQSKMNRIKAHKGHIFIINHDALKVVDLFEWMFNFKPEIIIVDESHKFKNHSVKRTKKLHELVEGKFFIEKEKMIAGKLRRRRLLTHRQDPINYRFILTGSPILNSPCDIWAQFKILNNQIFNDNFVQFRGQYMINKNANAPVDFPDWKPKPECYENLNNVIYQFADRVLKEDCLDLPPFMRIKSHVELTKEEKKHYGEMKVKFITFLEEELEENGPAMTAPIAMVKGLRLTQILCGLFVSDEPDEKGNRDVTRIPTNRYKVLEDHLETITPQSKVIVWSVFADTYPDIHKAFKNVGLKYHFDPDRKKNDRYFTQLTGKQSQKQKVAAIKALQDDPLCRGMLANQKAGGTGVNLTQASYSIYVTWDFSLEHHIQSEARNYRGGSDIHEKITRIDLVVPNSIQDYMLDALHDKQDMSEAILKMKEKLK